LAEKSLDIRSTTTVYEFLEAFPDLENTLIELAPPFKKIKNPMLRNSVAKIATIKNISAVGNIPLAELLNILRKDVGQSAIHEENGEENYFGDKPIWLSKEKVKVSIIEGQAGNSNEMNIVSVLREAKKLKKGEIIELITTLIPAPGIDRLKAKGYSAWTVRDKGEVIKSYFTKQ
jgi:TusA-related sulfurtransferase